jgi:hypothetical protein
VEKNRYARVAAPKEKAIGVPAKIMMTTSGPKKMVRLSGPIASHVAWKIQNGAAIIAVTAIAPIR